MKIPKKLVIDGNEWSVQIVKDYTERTGLLGSFIPRKKTILISADQSRLEQEVTFLHELLHAAWPTGIVSSQTEEKIINGMDQYLHELLSKNNLLKKK